MEKQAYHDQPGLLGFDEYMHPKDLLDVMEGDELLVLKMTDTGYCLLNIADKVLEVHDIYSRDPKEALRYLLWIRKMYRTHKCRFATCSSRCTTSLPIMEKLYALGKFNISRRVDDVREGAPFVDLHFTIA